MRKAFTRISILLLLSAPVVVAQSIPAGQIRGGTAGQVLTTGTTPCNYGVTPCGVWSAGVPGASTVQSSFTVGATAVVANELVKFDSNGHVIPSSTSDTSALGIAETSVTSGGTVVVELLGSPFSCVADNATTVNDLVTIGTTTAGTCRDAGTSVAGPLSMGRFLTAVSAGSVATVFLYGPGHQGVAAQNTALLGPVSGGSGPYTFRSITNSDLPQPAFTALTTSGTSGPSALTGGGVLNVPQYDAGGAAAAVLSTSLQKASNLSDVASPSTSRTNLGLGTIATQNASAVAITGGTLTGVSVNGVTPSTAAGSTTYLNGAGGYTTPPGTGGGTVNSVALTAPTWLAVAGSPVTSSGTLAITAATSQTSHQVIGTCGTATSFAPCALVAGDIPTLNQSTTGNAATATLATTANNIAVGALGSTPYQSGSGSTAFIASPTTTGTYLQGWTPTGSAISPAAINLTTLFSSPAFTGVPTVPTATAGTSTTQAASTAFVENAIGSVATSFSAITSGTNSVPAAMLVGAGSSLGYTSTGTVNASSLAGTAITGTPSGAAYPFNLGDIYYAPTYSTGGSGNWSETIGDTGRFNIWLGSKGNLAAATTQATSSTNYGVTGTAWGLGASFWNGTTSAEDTCAWTYTPSTGTNPNLTANFQCGFSFTTPSTGTHTIAFGNPFTAPTITATGLGTSTSPICPNGTGGAFTTAGCSGTLPTATASGQAPVSTGAGTTYTAQAVGVLSAANTWAGAQTFGSTVVGLANQTLNAATSATSSLNYASPSYGLQSSIWNGSTATFDSCLWANTPQANGSNPNMVASFTCSGSTGSHTISFGNPFTAPSVNGVYNAALASGSDIGAKVNTLVTACAGNSCPIYIPAGSYTYTTPIVLASNVNLYGAGRGVTNVQFTATSGIAITVGVATTNVNIHDFTLSGIVETPSTSTYNGVGGISILGTQSAVYNMQVAHFWGSGSAAVGFGGANDTLRDSFIEYAYFGVSCGSRGTTIKNNYISNHYSQAYAYEAPGVHYWDGIICEGGQYNLVDGNTIEDNGQSGIYVGGNGDAGYKNQITNNKVRYNWNRGIDQGVTGNVVQPLPINTFGTASSGSTALTVSVGTGIVNGDEVLGQGIPAGATVTGSGTSWTLSAATTAVLAKTPITFQTAGSNAVFGEVIVGNILLDNLAPNIWLDCVQNSVVTGNHSEYDANYLAYFGTYANASGKGGITLYEGCGSTAADVVSNVVVTGNVVLDSAAYQNISYNLSKGTNNAVTGNTINQSNYLNPSLGPSNAYYQPGFPLGCFTTGSPTPCGLATYGAIAIGSTGTSLVVNDARVTVTSVVQITPNQGVGSLLGLTCAPTVVLIPTSVTTAAGSFTITLPSAVAGSPECFTFTISPPN